MFRLGGDIAFGVVPEIELYKHPKFIRMRDQQSQHVQCAHIEC